MQKLFLVVITILAAFLVSAVLVSATDWDLPGGDWIVTFAAAAVVGTLVYALRANIETFVVRLGPILFIVGAPLLASGFVVLWWGGDWRQPPTIVFAAAIALFAGKRLQPVKRLTLPLPRSAHGAAGIARGVIIGRRGNDGWEIKVVPIVPGRPLLSLVYTRWTKLPLWRSFEVRAWAKDWLHAERPKGYGLSAQTTHQTWNEIRVAYELRPGSQHEG